MQSSKVIERKRIFGYDALKALAAFFVILYHVRMVDFGYREGEYYYPTLVQILWLFCACGVPLFFMVNGALTISRHYDFKKSLTKSGKLILIGVFWGIIIMCEKALFSHDTSAFSVSKVTYYWFLFSLALFYMANYMLDNLPGWCRWVVVVCLLIFPFTSNLVWDVIILLHPEEQMPHWGHIGVFTFYGLVYLYAGDYFSHHRCDRWLVVVFAIIGLFLLGLEASSFVNNRLEQFEGGNYCFPTIGALFLSCALFVWVKDWNPDDSLPKRFISFLGDNALGIYIFHLFILVVMIRVFPQLASCYIHPALAIGVSFVYLIVSALISELIRKSPLSFLLRL